MTSKLEAIDARVVAVESSLKNQEISLRNHEMLFRSHDSTLKEHTAQLTDHSTKLSSLMTSVADITKSIAMMHAEMREGFQLQHHPGKQKDKEETEKERSPISSFVLTGEEEKHVIHKPGLRIRWLMLYRRLRRIKS